MSRIQMTNNGSNVTPSANEIWCLTAFDLRYHKQRRITLDSFLNDGEKKLLTKPPNRKPTAEKTGSREFGVALLLHPAARIPTSVAPIRWRRSRHIPRIIDADEALPSIFDMRASNCLGFTRHLPHIPQNLQDFGNLTLPKGKPALKSHT